jgi:hypothetical protein
LCLEDEDLGNYLVLEIVKWMEKNADLREAVRAST